MTESQKRPLVASLIGHRSGLVYAQIEATLRDHSTIDFTLRRKPYSGLPDVEFSVDERDLEDIIEFLREVKKKTDTHWISRLAVAEQNE